MSDFNHNNGFKLLNAREQYEFGKVMFKSAARLSTGNLLDEGWFAGAPYKSRTFFLTMLLPDSRGPRTTADGPCGNGLESFGPTKNAFPLIRKMAVSGAIGGEIRGSRHQTFTNMAHDNPSWCGLPSVPMGKVR